MNERKVVTLVEVVLHTFPVPVPHNGHPVGALHVLHAVRIEVIGDGVQPGAEVIAFGVHVEPDEARPRVAGDLHQVAFATWRSLREVVLVVHPSEHARGVEPPAVIGALELAVGQAA